MHSCITQLSILPNQRTNCKHSKESVQKLHVDHIQHVTSMKHTTTLPLGQS